MDERLHALAKKVLPEQELPPNRLFVSVLFHHYKLHETNEFARHHFLWITARPRLTVAKVLEEYLKQTGVNVALRLRGAFPTADTALKHLDTYNDKLLVFRAFEKRSAEAQDQAPLPATNMSRQPLQPTNRQPLASPVPHHTSLKSPSIDPTRENADIPIKLEDDRTDEMPITGQRHIPALAVQRESRALPPYQQSLDQPQHELYNNIKAPLNQDTAVQVNPRQALPGLSHWKPSAMPAESPRASSYHAADPNGALAPLGPTQEAGASRRKHGGQDNARVKAEEQTLAAAFAMPVTGLFEHTARPELASQEDMPAFEEPPPPPSENEHLQTLLDDRTTTDVATLENGVEQGMQDLARLEEVLQTAAVNNQELQQWLDQVQALRLQSVKGRTVIGVVGNTGAGKSSVINAMLDEERLVPTNCMRACTAVVTEISWNYSDDPDECYQAHIEFVKADDWKRELQVLFKDLIDPNGEVSRDCTNADSEAGVAYAKIKSVYPHLTKDMMAEQNVEGLMRHPSVRNVLGRDIEIRESDAAIFYRRLQQYVDSKEKVTQEQKEKEKECQNKKKSEPRKMEHWPLIRVVKIYTKSDALSTGAVIVDLPGVQDSNAARAAVAEGYMKQCTGLWIVAPITRAVDDKAAKNLLGQQFKRQMKYDGTYSQVTFICSKTDDISITEAADTLGLSDTIEESWDRREQMSDDIKRLERERKQLDTSKDLYSDTIDDITTEEDTWRELLEKVEDGKTVHALREKKRKRTGEHKKRDRGSQNSRGTNSDDTSDDSDDSDEADNEQDDVQELPLTEEQIAMKLDQLKGQKRLAKTQKSGIADQQKALRRQVKEAERELQRLEMQMSAVCIKGRNKYSKGAIQQDFAAGIKELDQENAIEEDEENFDPDEDLRDYDEVARSLPVFCVSSRAYQKLSGRLQKDSAIAGFETKDPTGITQLQAHCKKITEAGRSVSCRTWLNSLNLLLNSLSLWCNGAGGSGHLTAQQRHEQKTFLQERLRVLELNLQDALAACLKGMSQNFNDSICDHFTAAVEKAQANANGTANSWGAHQTMGGLHWATYKATVRRDGVYTGTKGPRDFNGELSEPMMKQLMPGWERAFQRKLPMTLKEFTSSAAHVLRDFHQAVEVRARERGIAIAALGMLGNQLDTYSQRFNELADAMQATIAQKQRDANREFVPVVTAHMTEVYTVCTNENGKGSFARMKSHMTNHVAREKDTMFREATEVVKGHLDEICRTVREQMGEQMDFVVTAMQRDYKTAFGGQLNAKLPTPEVEADRKLKAELTTRILASHEAFHKVVGAPTPSSKPEQEPQIEQEPGQDVAMEVEEEDASCHNAAVRQPAIEAQVDGSPDRQQDDEHEAGQNAVLQKQDENNETLDDQQASAEEDHSPTLSSCESISGEGVDGEHSLLARDAFDDFTQEIELSTTEAPPKQTTASTLSTAPVWGRWGEWK